jgi:hypothetical protein
MMSPGFALIFSELSLSSNLIVFVRKRVPVPWIRITFSFPRMDRDFSNAWSKEENGLDGDPLPSTILNEFT